MSTQSNVLSGIFGAVASCCLVHLGLITFGMEGVLHAAGEGLRQTLGLAGGAVAAGTACEVIAGEMVCPS